MQISATPHPSALRCVPRIKAHCQVLPQTCENPGGARSTLLKDLTLTLSGKVHWTHCLSKGQSPVDFILTPSGKVFWPSSSACRRGKVQLILSTSRELWFWISHAISPNKWTTSSTGYEGQLTEPPLQLLVVPVFLGRSGMCPCRVCSLFLLQDSSQYDS